MRPNSISTERPKSRRIGVDERRLLITVLAAVAVVVVAAFVLKSTIRSDTWLHDFFFRRSFVQWVLLTAFTVGLFHLLFWRISAWRRERRAVRSIEAGESPSVADSVAGRRWTRLQSVADEPASRNSTLLAKHLAEHDEAELDAGYRVSGDIVQILPLIGFFGTVFGLSRGLYSSFLAEGGTSTRAFAKAIAIAFDNTLLGLALTIILFAVQSVLRKREEGILLHLNLRANDFIASLPPAREDAPETVIARSVKPVVDQLEKLQVLLESPSNELKTFVQTHTSLTKAITDKMLDEQKAIHEKVTELLSEHLKEQTRQLYAVISDKASTLVAGVNSIGPAIVDLKNLLHEIEKAAAGIRSEIAALAKEQQAQLKALGDSLNEVGTALGTRDASFFERLNTFEEQTTGKLGSLASETHGLADRLLDLANKVDALPEERRQIQNLASSIRELAVALAQRDSLMLESLKEQLKTHSEDLKSETARLISKPRTLTIVETAGGPSRDGGPKT